MRTFSNQNAGSLAEAVKMAQQAQADGLVAVISGGGTDLLQQIKDGLEVPDVLINLREITGQGDVNTTANGLEIGGLIGLDSLASNDTIRNNYAVLAQAALSVGTPQIRNVATLAGNIMQRPWCWYYRNGFNCYKAGGDQCFSVTGENQQHAIYGGGPSYIVHPSDLAPALVALNASFNVMTASGIRQLSAADFFVLPAQNPQRENAVQQGEVLAGVTIPSANSSARSAYHKVMDREAWTHAVVSAAIVLQMQGEECRSASIVLGGVAPIPWRLTAVEQLLAGQRITQELARDAGALAIVDARPLAKNGYKLPMVAAVMERTLLELVA